MGSVYDHDDPNDGSPIPLGYMVSETMEYLDFSPESEEFPELRKAAIKILKLIDDIDIHLEGLDGNPSDDSWLDFAIQMMYRICLEDVEISEMNVESKADLIIRLSRFLLILLEIGVESGHKFEIGERDVILQESTGYVILRSSLMIGDLLLETGILDKLESSFNYQKPRLRNVSTIQEARDIILSDLHEKTLLHYQNFLYSTSEGLKLKNSEMIEHSYFFRTISEYLDVTIDLPVDMRFERRYENSFFSGEDFALGAFARIYWENETKLNKITSINYSIKRLLCSVYSINRIKERGFREFLGHLLDLGRNLNSPTLEWDDEDLEYSELQAHELYEFSIFQALELLSVPLTCNFTHDGHRSIMTINAQILQNGSHQCTSVPLLVSGNVYDVCMNSGTHERLHAYSSAIGDLGNDVLDPSKTPSWLNHRRVPRRPAIANQINRFFQSAGTVLENLNSWMQNIDQQNGLGVKGTASGHKKRRNLHMEFYEFLGVQTNIPGKGPGRRIECMFSHPNKKPREKIISEIASLPKILDETLQSLQDFPHFRIKLSVIALFDVFFHFTRCCKSASYFDILEIIHDFDTLIGQWIPREIGKSRDYELQNSVYEIVDLYTTNDRHDFVEDYDVQKIISIQIGLREIYGEVRNKLHVPELIIPPEMISPIELQVMHEARLLRSEIG